MRRAKRIIVILALATLVLWVVRSVMPPDLSKCTRLKIRCPKGAMDYFFWHRDGLFDAEEKEYIRSCDTWVIEDPNRIQSFAEAVGHVTYYGRIPSFTSEELKITCYRGLLRIASLGTELADRPNWNPLRNRQARLIESVLEPPGIQRLKPRWYCVWSIRGLRFGNVWMGRQVHPYPVPSEWCDAIVEGFRQQTHSFNGGPTMRTYADAEIAAKFRCPATQKPTDPNELPDREAIMKRRNEPVREWISDYAMNPYCEPNSPKDTVLLFETKPGWNQHGGAELFNFDNHDPKGGCVLLNGGEVKFIRTKEELAQLRWEP